MNQPNALHFILLLLTAPLAAQVPNLVPHQGRVAVNGVNFDGTGQFKFALVNANGSTTYWSNNGSSTAGSQPTAAVSLPVTKGLYSVMLGDTTLANMTAVPASVYSNADLRLRVWFNNGTLGFQQLTPDQRLAPNGYLPDGAVTSAKLPDSAITAAKLADGAVTSAKMAPGATPPAVQVAGASQNVVPNTTYISTYGGNTTFNLPTTAAIGDVVNISDSGNGPLSGVSIFNPDSWTPREQFRNWRSVASSADGTKLIAAVTGGRIYTSNDSGQTWVARASQADWIAVASSADGSRLVGAVSEGQIYVSGDSGATWSPREQNRNWVSVASSADGTKLIAAVYSGQLYTSADSGVTWTPREQNRTWVSVASSADGTKLIAAVFSGQLYTSADSGVTWASREQTSQWLDVASSADGTRLVAIRQFGQIFTSSDSGITWTPREQERFWFSVASSADGMKLIAAGDRGWLYLSTDAGISWSLRSLESYRIDVASSADGNKLVSALQGGRLYTSWATFRTTGAESASFTFGSGGWKLNTPAGQWTPKGGDLYRASGNVGIGTTNPEALLQLGDKSVTNSQGLMRLASASPSGASWREWEVGVPGGTEDITGKNYSFIIDDLLAGGGQPEVTVRFDSGFVGIGTADPQAKLDVDTRGAGRVQIRNEGNFVPGLNITGGPLPGYLRFRNAFEIWPNDAGTAPGRMDIRSTTGAPTITMDGGTGSIGIGRTAASNRLEVEGNASKVTAGSWLANSDRRIKSDIKPVTGALETIAKVNPVTFRYTEDYRKAHPDIKDVPYYNVIAQEFREVFPNAVKSSGEKLPDGSEILQVDTYPATITALAAIKELKAENDALKAANQAMEQRLAALEEMMSRTKTVKINPNHQEVTP